MVEKQRGVTIWLTGLSGANKTTICQFLETELRRTGYKIEVLDGDVVRQNLSKGLTFSKEDRDEKSKSSLELMIYMKYLLNLMLNTKLIKKVFFKAQIEF
jgi:adenylylsulfate kinase-like enzyme